jgi:hypothetical protein
VFDLQAAGSHKISENERPGPRHDHPIDMPEAMLRDFVKQAGVEPDVSLPEKQIKGRRRFRIVLTRSQSL